MVDIALDPQRWESVEAGDQAVLERWLVAEGDHVRAGQVLAKAVLVHEGVDVEAPYAGILEQIAVAPGERFAPGHVLATLVSF